METENNSASQLKSGYGWPSVGLGLWLLVIIEGAQVPTPSFAQACGQLLLVAAGFFAMKMQRIPEGEIGRYFLITQAAMAITVVVAAGKLALVLLGVHFA